VNQSQIESFIWGVADLIRDNFNRYFYEYTPLWPLEENEADIQAIEKDIVPMLREVTG
jgi:hypothetical protein